MPPDPSTEAACPADVTWPARREPSPGDAADDPFVGTVVDFRTTGRRMRRSASVLFSLAAAGWLIASIRGGGLELGALGGWIGLALGAMFVVEVVVVGGSAVRGMLRAGERGDRLAGGDVGLLPTQLLRRQDRNT